MSTGRTGTLDHQNPSKPTLSRAGFGYLALLLAFASISTDLYLPAMPTMTDALGTSHGSLELTVSGYLFGFAIGQLFWGPYSDRRGRRMPLAMGLVLFILGSLGCGLATNVVQLIAMRVVQAIGASASVVIGRAIIADLFQGKEAARILSTLTAIMVVAPMLGPLIGARILAISSWRAIFFLLVGIGVFTLLMLFRIVPESLPPVARNVTAKIIDRNAYREILANPRLVTYALISMFFTAGIFAYVAGSSFVFISWGGLSPDMFGLIFGAGAALIIASNLINARLVSRYGTDTMLLGGIIVAISASSVLLIAAMLDANIWVIVIFIVLYAGSNGFIQANAISGGLNAVTEARGRASAFLGFTQYGGGMIGSAVLGLLANGTPYPLFVILAVTSIGSLFLILRVRTLAS